MRTHLLVPLVLVVAVGCGTLEPAFDPAWPDPPTGSDAGPAAADGGPGAGTDAGADCNAGITPAADLVRTERGPVRGLVSGSGARSFLGIPYVKPPVGVLRWRPPEEDLACWQGVQPATAWPVQCPQLEQTSMGSFDAGAPILGSEDCLRLNVFTPPGAVDGGFPVMVFIHGGGNTVGSSTEAFGGQGVKLYDGSALAERGRVVVVTLQYRLGVLGFLALGPLDAESDAGVSGNYALLDQQAALRWVQRNIPGFGGDPSRVTLFGESAGAVNTCMQLASPGARGLFHRAIIQSGSCAAPPLAVKRSEGQKWLAATGCAAASDVPACLRAMTPDQLIRAYPVPVNVIFRPDVVWGPNVDGHVLPGAPLSVIRSGGGAAVPVMVGSNADETASMVPVISTEAEYLAYLSSLLGPSRVSAVAALYPVSKYGTPRKALVQATTDGYFGCQARAASRAAAHGHALPVYRYLFSRALVPARGAFHGIELPYVFQRLGAVFPTVPAVDVAAEAAVLGYWTRFAATGNPNGPAPAWPRLDASETLLEVSDVTALHPGWRNAECDYFDGSTAIPPPP